MINLSTSQMKIIKAIGYPAFFFCCYVVFLTLTFPADRFLPVAEVQLSKVLGREVTIDNLAVSPLGSVRLTGVTIEVPGDEGAKKNGSPNPDSPRDTAAGKDTSAMADTGDTEGGKAASKPIAPKYYIEEMRVSVSVWSLIFGDLNVSVAADFLGGDILVNYRAPMGNGDSEEQAGDDADLANLPPGERAKISRERRAQKAAMKAGQKAEAGNESSLSIVATGLNLVQFWDLKDLLPLPMFGNLDFGIELKTPTGKMADAEGKMWIDGRGISLGQGQSKIEIIDGMGPMTIDSFGIDALQMEMKAVKGKFTFDRVKVVSKDLAATAQGDVQFADPISMSRLNLYFTFKLLEGYASKSPNAQTLVSLMPGALSSAKRADDSYGFIYQGTFRTARFRPQKIFGPADRPTRTTSRRSTRPTTRGRSISRPVQPANVAPRPTPPAIPTPTPAPEPPPVVPPPEHMSADAPTPPGRTAALRDMAEEMQQRQNESESKRAEAAIRAKQAAEAREAQDEESENEEEEEEREAKGNPTNTEDDESEDEGGEDAASPESEDPNEEGGEAEESEGEAEVEAEADEELDE